MSDGTTITTNGERLHVTEKVFDHGVDALGVLGITAAAYAGAANEVVVFGIATIALGKRVLQR